MKAKVGLIPIIVSEEMKQDRFGIYEKIAEIGYAGIEGVQGGDNAEETKAKLQSLGLKAICCSARKETLQDPSALEALIEEAKFFGAPHISLWWGPCESKDELLADAEIYNAAGKRIAEAGLKFCYHNHDHEFKTTFDGKYALDVLLDATDADAVYCELDVAWVTYGGADPCEYLRKRAGRIPAIHLKDIADLDDRGKFTAVGTGVIDVKGVVETALATGVDWVVVEQDRPNNLTPIESLTASFLNIKELGLV
jgi:sugar phosphate isomerase/epimerase